MMLMLMLLDHGDDCDDHDDGDDDDRDSDDGEDDGIFLLSRERHGFCIACESLRVSDELEYIRIGYPSPQKK